jgi:hypothetical protein
VLAAKPGEKRNKECVEANVHLEAPVPPILHAMQGVRFHSA